MVPVRCRSEHSEFYTYISKIKDQIAVYNGGNLQEQERFNLMKRSALAKEYLSVNDIGFIFLDVDIDTFVDIMKKNNTGMFSSPEVSNMITFFERECKELIISMINGAINNKLLLIGERVIAPNGYFECHNSSVSIVYFVKLIDREKEIYGDSFFVVPDEVRGIIRKI